MHYARSHAGDRVGFIQAASEAVTVMGTCNAQIQEWHPRAQGVLEGLGLAPRKRNRGLKVHLTPSERGHHPWVTRRSAGAWEGSDDDE